MLKSKSFFIISTVTLFLGVFFYARFVALANSSQSATGWGWDGSEASQDGAGVPPNGNETGLGLISFNSSTCDTDGNLTTDSCDMNGDGTVDASDNRPIANYGVDIPMTPGPVTGYAWSDNYGWIDFDSPAHCGIVYSTAAYCTDPSSGNGGVQRSGNILTGWARVVSIAQASVTGNNGGWDGWIQMTGPNHTVSITGSSSLSGFAWNGETNSGGNLLGIGAIDMSAVNIICTPAVGSDSYSCRKGTCSSSIGCDGIASGLCVRTNSCGVSIVSGTNCNGGAGCGSEDVICKNNCPDNGWKEVNP